MIWRIRRWYRKWRYRLTGKRNTLVGTWTLEPAEDLMHLHGFDCEDELVKILSAAIAEEVQEDFWNWVYFRDAWVETMPRYIAYRNSRNGRMEVL